MSDQRERMAALSGERAGGKAPRYVLPLIKFNGNTGEFRRYDSETKEATPLPKTISIVILKNRKNLEDFDSGLSSTEFYTTGQKVTLFKNEGGKYKKEAVDTPPELREIYPGLRTQEILYVLYEGEIHKLTVKGGSSTQFYKYRDVLKEAEKHSFEVLTEVSAIQETNAKTKKKYYAMAFTNKDLEISLDDIEASMLEVDSNLKKIDDFNTGKLLEHAKENGSILVPSTTVRSAADTLKDMDDELNPEDIPF